jgi:hypothetical protein
VRRRRRPRLARSRCMSLVWRAGRPALINCARRARADLPVSRPRPSCPPISARARLQFDSAAPPPPFLVVPSFFSPRQWASDAGQTPRSSQHPGTLAIHGAALALASSTQSALRSFKRGSPTPPIPRQRAFWFAAGILPPSPPHTSTDRWEISSSAGSLMGTHRRRAVHPRGTGRSKE